MPSPASTLQIRPKPELPFRTRLQRVTEPGICRNDSMKRTIRSVCNPYAGSARQKNLMREDHPTRFHRGHWARGNGHATEHKCIAMILSRTRGVIGRAPGAVANGGVASARMQIPTSTRGRAGGGGTIIMRKRPGVTQRPSRRRPAVCRRQHPWPRIIAAGSQPRGRQRHGGHPPKSLSDPSPSRRLC